jgi:hypothetical protein
VLPTPGKLAGFVSKDAPGKWIIFGPNGFKAIVPLIVDGGKAVVWQGDAGEYAVIYLPPGDAQPEPLVVVLGGGENPPKPPDPKPEPGGPYQVVLFYSPDQLDNLTPDQRQILNSQAFREKLKATGHSLLGVLPDNAAPSPQSKFRAFYNAVAGDPMPRVAVASKDGGKVADFPLPATVAELEALLKTEVLK